MKRIHIPNMGPDKSKIPTAIAIGIRECKNVGISDLILITPLKNNLDSIVVGEFLGGDVSKRLMKGEKIPIGNGGASISHHSVSTILKCAAPKIGLVFYVSSEDIKKLDDLMFECMIFVPWLDKDGEEWSQKWNAETHGEPTFNSEIDLPSEVTTALLNLRACVNLSTGLAHPSDKKHAKHKFSELRAAGIKWNPLEVEKWAVRNGWKASYAKELSKLSSRYT
jgi:hypothetical protein